MNLNDSSLSTSSTSHPTLARIVSNVVETQQQLVTQIQSVTTALESLKLEHNSSIQALREDWRRTDDRSQKQIEEIRDAHKKEITRLLDLIKTLVDSKQEQGSRTVQPPVVPQPFLVPGHVAQSDVQRALMMQNDPQLRMMFLQQQQQQQQHQQAQLVHQLQQSHIAQNVLQAHAQAQAQAHAQAQAQAQAQVQPQTQVPQPQIPVPMSLPAQQASSLPLNAHQSTSFNQKAFAPAIIPTPAPAVDNEKTAATTPAKVEAPKPAISFGSLFGQNSQSADKIKAAPITNPIIKKEESSPAPAQPFPAFGSKPFTPSVTTPVKADTKDTPKAADDEDKVEEFEPQVDFKPVVPLPDLVDVVTGEEGEETLFENKCKLFRFAETKEWKERGTGTIKILLDLNTSKRRVVMRRDQVHKVCANHPLSKGMTISKMPKKDKAVIWHCMDFSDEEQKHEQFCARFASVEVAENFMKIFQEGVESSVEVKTPVKKSGDEKPVNKTETNAPKEEPKQQGFGDKFKLKGGEWNCTDCYTKNADGVAACICCGYNKDGTASKDVFPKSIIPQPTGPSKFSFGVAAAAAAKESDNIPVGNAKPGLFGSGITNATSSFNAGSSSPSIFGGNKGSTPSASTSGTPSASGFSFSTAGASSSAATSSATGTPVNFSFKNTGKTLFGSAPGSAFGQAASAAAKEADKDSESSTSTTPASSTAAPTKVFGSAFSTGVSFANFASKSPSGGIFSKENSEKAKAELASQQKNTLFANLRDKKKDEDGSGDEGAEGEFEPDVNFTPACPLPELVKVVTGEENEEVVFSSRSKLFRFDNSTKENKERGVGELKILKNPDTGKYRVVMRREQVHKLCANFHISKDITLKPKASKPEVYSWMCTDFAEDPEGRHEIFTAKFKNQEIAEDFVKVFGEAQSNV